MTFRNHRVLRAIAAGWFLLAGSGFAWLGRYERLAGADGGPPEAWPKGSLIGLSADRPTLLMFAHPRCPCTRASLEELARLVERSESHPRAVVFFFEPRAGGEEWRKTALWRRVQSIPGMEARPDEEGAEARRFHCETSGHAVLYDTNGHLRFAGGITAARGQEGENEGRRALESILNEGRAIQMRTPVFGCSLITPETKCQTTTESCRP